MTRAVLASLALLIIGAAAGITADRLLHRAPEQRVAVLLRIDTPVEVDYYRHGGILPYVLREIVQAA